MSKRIKKKIQKRLGVSPRNRNSSKRLGRETATLSSSLPARGNLGRLRHFSQILEDVQGLVSPPDGGAFKGVETSSRFLPGRKGNGDYFEIYPTKKGQYLLFFLFSPAEPGLSYDMILHLMHSCDDPSRSEFFLFHEKLLQNEVFQNSNFAYIRGFFSRLAMEWNITMAGDIVAFYLSSESLECEIWSSPSVKAEVSYVKPAQKGDVLTLVSRGVLEHLSSQDIAQTVKVYGLEMTKQNLSLHFLRNAIYRRIFSQIENLEEISSDATVMCFRVHQQMITIV